jgi:hypothetical protein
MKSTNGKTTGATTARTSAMPRPTYWSEQRADADVSRQAFDFYEARGCDDGHDVEDWLQAERELGLGHALGGSSPGE